MNDWIWLDPQELASAGVLLRDVSQELIASIDRTRSACCVTGLGRHAGPLMGEAETVARQVETVTEVYLRLAIDVLQRAIAAVQQEQLASAVGSVGSVSSAIIGGSATVGGFVLGQVTPVSTSVIGGSATVGGFYLGQTSPVSTAVIGGSTVGGYYHGGSNGLATGAMAFAQAAQASQERQRAILERLRASGGGGLTSTDLGTQTLTKMNNDAMTKRLNETEVKIAASQPFAGIVQAEAADKLDGLGRARAIEDKKFYEQKFYEQKYDEKKYS